ncbi:hypothetical protein BO82DRAFT_194854 [Aspergillus uvarum CBS 121591]|uniref:Secreted protein n=1 Tax=Aspergillus uvarum CBS 121591 TaxID=1448315 RepID=A0A319BT38_9EURO|nr:hypothetical protein BO82DRAFT_194854 [Aspergillus uvarum CBS 121591]PYH76766.1 hypothetical protein BO82DRAFT_194854 [Aspergillus uvarum CBS 121591]
MMVIIASTTTCIATLSLSINVLCWQTTEILDRPADFCAICHCRPEWRGLDGQSRWGEHPNGPIFPSQLYDHLLFWLSYRLSRRCDSELRKYAVFHTLEACHFSLQCARSSLPLICRHTLSQARICLSSGGTKVRMSLLTRTVDPRHILRCSTRCCARNMTISVSQSFGHRAMSLSKTSRGRPPDPLLFSFPVILES